MKNIKSPFFPWNGMVCSQPPLYGKTLLSHKLRENTFLDESWWEKLRTDFNEMPALSVNVKPLKRNDSTYNKLWNHIEDMNENPSLAQHIIINDNETEMNKMIKEKKLDLNDKIPEYTTKLSLLVEINEHVIKIIYKKEDDELKYDSYENILCLNETAWIISDHLPPAKSGSPISSLIDDIRYSYAIGVVDVTYLYASVRIEYPLGDKFMELAKDEYKKYEYDCDVSRLLDDVLWDIYLKFDSDEDLRFITLCAKLSSLLPFSTQHLLKNRIVERYPTILEKALVDWDGF